MGWNRDVGFDNQIHSYGHRVETALALSPPGQGFWHRCEARSAFTRFTCIDREAPGEASCGGVHNPPNAGRCQ